MYTGAARLASLVPLPIDPALAACRAEHRAWQTLTDPLTGLADRRALYLFIDRLIAQSTPFALLLADLDFFKDVNDTLGHDAGDAVLLELGRRLSQAAPADGLVARLGGDEFAIVVPGVDDPDGALAAISAVGTAASGDLDYRGHALDCQISIGAAIASPPADRVQVVKQADIALYRAKSDGRGRGALYDHSMAREVDRRAGELAAARAALGSGSLAVHYQPKVDLQTLDLAGLEALLRLREGSEMVGPGTIAAALDHRQIASQIGRTVLERVLVDARRWLVGRMPFGHIAINVADGELRDSSWAPMLLHRAASEGIPPWVLQVEVTESALLKRSAEVVRNGLELLHAQGVKIALDDFGTGFSSLAHLRDFPVDIIKIDRSFIAALDHPDSAALVRATIGLGKSLGMTVVAEGIERAAQHSLLKNWGCDQGQGFYYARPSADLPCRIAGQPRLEAKP